MQSSEAYLAEHRIQDIMQHLCYALVANKPEDHVAFSKQWLENLRDSMASQAFTTAHGVNLLNINGLYPMTFAPPANASTAAGAGAAGRGGSASASKAQKKASSRKLNPALQTLLKAIGKLDQEDVGHVQKYVDSLLASKKSKKQAMESIAQRHVMAPPPIISVENVKEESNDENLVHSVRTRRIAVSATPLGVEQVQAFKLVEIEKSPEQKEKLNECINTSTLFSNFSEEEKEKVVMAMNKEDFQAGTAILQQHEPGRDTFFLIMNGNVAVVKDDKVVATMGPGQYFGELELMYNTPSCAATVKALSAVETYSLGKEVYQHIVLGNALARRELFMSLIDKVDFLSDMTEYNKLTLAEALTTHVYEDGEFLIRCGETSHWMYILMEGRVKIVGRREGKKVDIVEYGEGEVVGELEFLFNHEAVADVIAVKRTKVARLNRKHFEMCMGPIHDNLIAYVNHDKYSHYRAQADDEVKKSIEQAKMRDSRLVMTPDQMNLDFLPDGEIAFGAGEGHFFRFPFAPTQGDNLIVVGLQEDGTVMFWNSVMHRLTSHSAEGTVGQSIFTLVLEESQGEMFQQFETARKWAGNCEGYLLNGKRSTISFRQASGLTKATASVLVLPPVVSQPRNRAEVFLMVGHETKIKPVRPIEKYEWFAAVLAPQIEKVLCEMEAVGVNKSSSTLQIGVSTLKKSIQKIKEIGNTKEQDVRLSPVNLKIVMSKIITELSGESRQRNNNLTTVIEDSVPHADIFMDPERLPECLIYLVRVVNRYLSDVSIAIRAKVTSVECVDSEDQDLSKSSKHADDIKTITYSVENTGPVLEVCEIANNSITDPKELAEGGRLTSLSRVRKAVGNMGGIFDMESTPELTTISISFPLLTTNINAPSGPGSLAPGGEGAQQADSRGFTTVIADTSTVHRSVTCQRLWERQHAVLPAVTWPEVARLIDGKQCDILIVDPESLPEDHSGEIADPYNVIKQWSLKLPVIVCSETFDATMIEAYDEQGLLALPKPSTAARLHIVAQRAEAVVQNKRKEMDRINQLRETFSKTNRGAWKRGKLLGRGAFGEVYEAFDVLTGGKMAMKEVKITESNKGQIEELISEIETMTTLQHDNIIHYFYCEKTETRLYIFMELAAGGNLEDLIRKTAPGGQAHSSGKIKKQKSFTSKKSSSRVSRLSAASGTSSPHCPEDEGRETTPTQEYEGLPLPQLVTYLKDIVNGIQYIHSNMFLHSDIKTANILLDGNNRAKLGDFGTAKQLDEGEKLYVMRGTPSYMAPEVMNCDAEEKIGFDIRADIWSLGCLVLEMATGRPPFYHIGASMGLIRYISELHDTPDLSPLFDAHPFVFEFVKACLDPDPEKRPTAKELLNFSLLSDDDLVGNTSSANAAKMMERAKLLHALNEFVAFQEPEEGEEDGSGEGTDQREDSSVSRTWITKASENDGFFSDSEDEGKDEDDDEPEDEVDPNAGTKAGAAAAAQTKNNNTDHQNPLGGVARGTTRSFNLDLDDEPEADEPAPLTKSPLVFGWHKQAARFCSDDDDDANDSRNAAML